MTDTKRRMLDAHHGRPHLETGSFLACSGFNFEGEIEVGPMTAAVSGGMARFYQIVYGLRKTS